MTQIGEIAKGVYRICTGYFKASANGKSRGVIVIVCFKVATLCSSRDQILTVASAAPEAKNVDNRLDTAMQLMELL